jgi:uncharacterized protein YbbC (DUF1343 family)
MNTFTKKLFAAIALIITATPLHAGVKLGIDVLKDQGFAPLRGKRVGLITNQTGVDGSGTKTRFVLKKNVNLVALYTPEHGLDGTEGAGKYVASRTDRATGLRAFSLYGPTRKPSPAMLRGVDVLVFDIQDIGCRSYTYVSTMIKCMEAAGEAGIDFVVLDRPNPLGGLRVEGPGMEARWISFVGQVPVPYVHGMTVGEIARMANSNGWVRPRCKLAVVPMQGWSRGMVWRDTGLRWVRPSPNIPNAGSPFYYVATGLIGELRGVECGCGGPTPFEVLAYRGVNGERFAKRMNGAGTGVSFSPTGMGARLRIPESATGGNLTAVNIHALAEFNRQSPGIFARSKGDHLDLFYKCYGSASIRESIERGVSAEVIVAGWSGVAARFRSARAPYLLY